MRIALLIAFALSIPAVATARRTALIPGDAAPGYAHAVAPVVGQGGMVLSTAVDPVPGSLLLVAGGLRYGTQERGRTTYTAVSSALLVGGQWNPDKAPWLGLGGELVVFQSNTINTELPPAINTNDSYFDLGNLRLGVVARLFELSAPVGSKSLELVISPFVKLGMPTDTSRKKPEQQMPVRTVVDGSVFTGPYLTIEPGVSVGFNLWVFGLYTHQAILLAPVVDGRTHVYYAMHTWLGVSIVGKLEILAQVDALLSGRERFNMENFGAWGISPAVRLHTGSASWELAARFAISDDGYYPYGDVSGIFTFRWAFDKESGE